MSKETKLRSASVNVKYVTRSGMSAESETIETGDPRGALMGGLDTIVRVLTIDGHGPEVMAAVTQRVLETQAQLTGQLRDVT